MASAAAAAAAAATSKTVAKEEVPKPSEINIQGGLVSIECARTCIGFILVA